MVYESDFYTTRRPYRATPSLSTYTITTPSTRYYTVRDSPERSRRTAEEQYSYSYSNDNSSSSSSSSAADRYGIPRPQTRSYSTTERTEPSRQIRILPGLGKVHVVHSYDRIVPYMGHKRLTVVTPAPTVVRVRPSVLYREFDRIESKYRPYIYSSAVNDYLNSESSVRIVYSRNPLVDSSYYTDIYRPNYTTSRYYNYWYPPRYYPRLYSYLTSPYYPYAPISRFSSNYSSYPTFNDPLVDSFLYPSKNYHFSRMFDDETRLIRAQSAALMKRLTYPTPRTYRQMPLPYVSPRYEEFPVRWTSDDYINKMLVASPTSNYKSEYTTYSSEPVRKYFGQGHLAAVTLVGDKAQPRRRNVYVYVEPENRRHPVMKDIELMSYYINRMRQDRATKQKTMPSIVVLDPHRPSRIFSVPQPLEDPEQAKEITKLREERAARLAKIMDISEEPAPVAPPRAKKEANQAEKEKAKRDEEFNRKKVLEAEAAKKEKEALAKEEEAAKKAVQEREAQAKKDKDEAAKKAELAAKAAAEKAAQAEKLAELARQEELAKQAEIEKARAAEEERLKLEEEKRLADEAKAEEERQQLLRLEEIARQAEEEQEAELARQAEELAELARQEAELAEQSKREEELAEQQRQAAEAEQLARQQEELAELERKEQELVEQARIEAELAEQALAEAQSAQQEADDAPVIVEEPTESVEEAAPEGTVGDEPGESAEISVNAEEEEEEEEEE